MDVRSLVCLTDQPFNSCMYWHLDQLNSAMFRQFHQELTAAPWQFNLSGNCQVPWYLPFRKSIDVPTCVPFLIFSIIQALMAYYSSLEYCSMEPKAEAIPPFKSPIYTPWHQRFIGLGPILIPDQASFAVCVILLLPFTLVWELDSEWHVICISWYHFVGPHM